MSNKLLQQIYSW